ncbi:MAG TPA: hypothetical protein VLH10_01040 [Yinghuangia sp.]|nr:hypothetical protein [Yinghuangia sp.]
MTSAGVGGRPYPTGADYSEALRDTATCFEHPTLARGLVAMGPLRMPRVVSGNFGSVFRVTGVGGAGGREYAVKCFTRAVPDRLRRYQAIAEAVRTARGRWRVDVEYVPRGVLVHGHWYPIVLMEWVDGSGLVPWLEEHLGDRAAIEALADQFAVAVGDLERSGVAHGDLQHGNIVVGRDGVLRLIDYDGMYVPTLAGLGPAEHGHRNYQHPGRGPADFGPGLDRFSAHVIHLSLRVLAREPWLWETYHEEGGEHLLLRAEDLAAPAASERFAVVSGTCPELAGEFARLAYWAGQPVDEVGKLGEPVAGAGREAGQGLPDWLAEAARSVRDLGAGARVAPKGAAGAAGAHGRTPPASQAPPSSVPGTQFVPPPPATDPARSTPAPQAPPLVRGTQSAPSPASTDPARPVNAFPAGVGRGTTPNAGTSVPPSSAHRVPRQTSTPPPERQSGAHTRSSSRTRPSNQARPSTPGQPSAQAQSQAHPQAAPHSAPPLHPRHGGQPQPHAHPSGGFSSLSRRTRWTARLSLAAVLALTAAAGTCTATIAVGAGPPLLLLIGALAAFGTTAAVAGLMHRRLRRAYSATPEVRRYEDANAEREQAGDAVMDALRQLGDCEASLQTVHQARADFATAQLAEAEALRVRHAQDCDALGKRLADALESVEQRRELLEASGPREEAQALRDLHDRALRDGLADNALPADLLGSRLVTQLGREGILTAADFVRVTSAVPTSPHLRAQATLSRPGRTVRVDGMSPALARRLQEWRDEIVEDLRLRLPATLPYQVAQELHRKRAGQRIGLAREAARIRATALAELTALEAEFDTTQQARHRTGVRETVRVDAAVQTAEDALQQAQKTYDQALNRATAARDACAALSATTYSRFLRDALLGS